MLNYEAPFGAAGAAGGAGVMGALGRLLEPLDYPRQALWNLPASLSRGDVVGALPGLLGAGATAALAASGVGLPLALLGGAALGGVGQGIGKVAGEDLGARPGTFEAPGGADVARAVGLDPSSVPGTGVSLAAQLLGDPLTYAGGIGGAAKGGAYGKHLEELGMLRGPMYPGGMEKLAGAAQLVAPGEEAAQRLKLADWLRGVEQSPYRDRLLAELAPGSVELGRGVEARAFLTPEGTVTRIAGGPGTYDLNAWQLASPQSRPPSAAPPVPGMIQPARDLPIGPYRVQHSPLLDVLKETDMAREEEWLAAQKVLEGAARGPENLYNPFDVHLGNIGKVPSTGRYVISDPGAVAPRPGTPPIPEPIRQDVTGSALDNVLLAALGAGRSIRRGIPRAVEASLPTQGLAVPEAEILARRQAAADALLAAQRTRIEPPPVVGGPPRTVMAPLGINP